MATWRKAGLKELRKTASRFEICQKVEIFQNNKLPLPVKAVFIYSSGFGAATDRKKLVRPPTNDSFVCFISSNTTSLNLQSSEVICSGRYKADIK